MLPVRLRLGSADMIASRPVTMEITTNDGSFQWSLSNSSYHQATVNQIAWHEDINQWGSAPRTPGRETSVKWVISLCTCATFCFLSLQSRESLWGALLGADWQTVQEALLPSALSAGGTWPRDFSQIFYIFRYSWAMIRYHFSTLLETKSEHKRDHIVPKFLQ